MNFLETVIMAEEYSVGNFKLAGIKLSNSPTECPHRHKPALRDSS
jgi:hypothetical protein